MAGVVVVPDYNHSALLGSLCVLLQEIAGCMQCMAEFQSMGTLGMQRSCWFWLLTFAYVGLGFGLKTRASEGLYVAAGLHQEGERTKVVEIEWKSRYSRLEAWCTEIAIRANKMPISAGLHRDGQDHWKVHCWSKIIG